MHDCWHTISSLCHISMACSYILHACMLVSCYHFAMVASCCNSACRSMLAISPHLLCCRTSQMPSTLQASLTASCGRATHTKIFASGDLRPCPGRAEHRGCLWDLRWCSSLWLPSHSTRNTTMSTLDTDCERLAMAKHECHGVGDWLDSMCEVKAHMAPVATSAETRACNETCMISSW